MWPFSKSQTPQPSVTLDPQQVALEELQGALRSKVRAKEVNRDHLQSQNGLYAVWMAKKLGVDFPKPSWVKDTLLPMVLAGTAAISMGTALPFVVPAIAEYLKPKATIPDLPDAPILDAPIVPPEVSMSLPPDIDTSFVKALGEE